MPATSVSAALRYIRALFVKKKAEGQSDQHLLEQFVSQRDESAFAALLQRHGPMAMGVCMRILHDEHLAEDALQATFLVLAMKAGTLRAPGSLAGWLYGVALRLARKLKAQVLRSQRQVERKQPEAPPTPLEASRREEKELLDEEMERLPDKYRLPLLLCHYEGCTQEEAAAQLGLTAGQLKGLLDRGRERLRQRLIRRGVALSATATLAAGSSLTAAVPSTLAVSTIKAGMNVISGQKLAVCGVSAAVATLAKGELIMGPKKILLILALVLLTGTIAVAAGMWSQNRRNADGPRRGPEKAALEEEGDGKGKDKKKKKEDEKKKEDADAEPEEAIIGRLIEILKNPAMSDEERVLASEALGKRGSKAKRALPDLVEFFSAKEADKKVLRLNEEQLKKIMVAAAAIGRKSPENFKILTTALMDAQDTSICVEALDALGRIGANSQKTFDLLLASTKANQSKAPHQQSLRVAAVGALANLGATSNKDLKAKSQVELQLLSETELDVRVRDAARAGLLTLEGTVAATAAEDLVPNLSFIYVLLDNDGNGEGKFTFQSGRVDGITQSPTIQNMKDRGFAVESAGQEVKVVARAAKPGIYGMEVAAKGGKKGASLWVSAKYAPLTVSGLKGGMIETKILSYGVRPAKLEMKIATGQAERVWFIGAKMEPECLAVALNDPRYKKFTPDQQRLLRAMGLTVTFNDDNGFKESAPNRGLHAEMLGYSLMNLGVALSEDKSTVIIRVEGGIPGAYEVLLQGRDAAGKESFVSFSVILSAETEPERIRRITDSVNNEKLVGVWEVSKSDSAPKGARVEFTKDGKMKLKAKVMDKEFIIDGTYKVKDNKITSVLTFGGKTKEETVTIKKLTDSELQVEDEKGKIEEYQRVK